MKNKFYYILTFAVAVLAVCIDTVSKLLVCNFVQGKTVDIIPGFFSLVYSVNMGAIFGTMKGMLPLFLMVLVLFLLAVFYGRKKLVGNKPLCVAFGLICGGAVGNIIDRLLIPPFGGVTDFLDFHLKSSAGLFSYPVFNFADMCIIIGVIIFLFKYKTKEVKGE